MAESGDPPTCFRRGRGDKFCLVWLCEADISGHPSPSRVLASSAGNLGTERGDRKPHTVLTGFQGIVLRAFLALVMRFLPHLTEYITGAAQPVPSLGMCFFQADMRCAMRGVHGSDEEASRPLPAVPSCLGEPRKCLHG